MKRCLHEKKKTRKKEKEEKVKQTNNKKNQLYTSAGEELNVLFN